MKFSFGYPLMAHPQNPDRHRENFAEQAAIGVTGMSAPIVGDSRSQVVEAVQQYGEEIIAYR